MNSAASSKHSGESKFAARPTETPAVPESGPVTRVFIVDDHPLIRYALRMVISAQSDMEVCGESEDGPSGLQQILKLRPDVTLVDISLKGYSGIELIKALRASNPDIRVIAVSMHPESIYGARALRAGAHGYCMKNETSDRLLAAIRRVSGGGISISGSLADHMLQRMSMGLPGDDTPSGGTLTDRELEVVELIGSGLTTQEIAVKLHISVKTIETHRAHIKEKLDLKNATQLVQACTRWVEETRHDRSGQVPVPAGDGSAERANGAARKYCGAGAGLAFSMS